MKMPPGREGLQGKTHPGGARGDQVACETAAPLQEYKSETVNLQPTTVSHDIWEILLRCFVPTLFLHEKLELIQ
jgi:hypothetical protein